MPTYPLLKGLNWSRYLSFFFMFWNTSTYNVTHTSSEDNNVDYNNVLTSTAVKISSKDTLTVNSRLLRLMNGSYA
jgi:hypothetical protein